MSKLHHRSTGVLAVLLAASTIAFNAGPAPASGSLANAADKVPQWIWSSPAAAPNQEAFFRREIHFKQPPAKATLRLTCDNRATIFLGKRKIGSMTDWTAPIEIDLTPFLSSGRNELVVHAKNQGGPAGLLAVLDLDFANGSTERVVTSAAWDASADGTFRRSQPAVVLGAHGVAPWGVLPNMPADALDRHIEVAPGFTVDLVYAVPRSQGSWVSLAVDDHGRFIASDQYGGLYRVTLASGDETTSNRVAVEQIDSPVGAAQGLACVGDDLYCVVSGQRAEGPGLYRLRDTDGDDQYDTEILVRGYPGAGEHGPHAVIEGPDGMLYVVAGNHTPLPTMEKSAVPRHWDEDHLLPRMWDARGHAVGILAPGGWIARTDPEGASWELLSTGYRNSYDIAFNRDGELFTYDADMEWDLGAPWYRPTRVNHAVSGSDFGWRAGTAKWPTHYPDSLPAVLDIGPGSPTGITFGYGTNFPQQYRDALFILDWTFGTMYAVSLRPNGASYTATRETFLTGRPLPLADAVVNPADGALYFIVGGRNTPSALYRVRYTGPAEPNEQPTTDTDATAEAARAQRKGLESLHRDDAPESAIAEIIWPALDDSDRFIRYAARIALEHQPLKRWEDRAFREQNPQKRLAVMLAMARCGDATHQSRMAGALSELQWSELDRESRLALLRCWALCFIRLGEPDAATATLAREILTPVYPSGDDAIDRELCDLLVYLQSPMVVARTIPLMEQTDVRTSDDAVDPALLSRNDSYGLTILQMSAARPQQGQVHYALALRNARTGWTPELRQRYFRWFQTASRAAGGLSYRGFVDNIRDEALENAPTEQRQRLTALAMGDQPMIAAEDLPMAEGPGRAWTVDELLDLVKNGMERRDYENGRAMYTAATCHRCHRFAGEGEVSGPDLTAITTRFSTRDLVESLVEPSRTISDQYALTEFVLNNDRVLLGRIVGQDDQSFTVMSSFLAPNTTYELPREMVATRRASTMSPMMPNLLDAMNADDALDLLAYLLAEGDPDHPMFSDSDDDEVGFVQLFNGVSLANWEGDLRFWRVEHGAIVGQTTSATAAPHNTFLTWTGDVVGDFELRAEVSLIGDNNSGIQYRAKDVGDHQLHGYQCDIHPQPDYNAMLYEEGGRAIMATHGQRLVIGSDGSVAITREDPPAPVESMELWNEYRIIARGSRLEHRLNGEVTIVVDDRDASHASQSGLIGLQLHAGGPYTVRFRNIRLHRLADRGQPP